jgi:hypothetical protein
MSAQLILYPQNYQGVYDSTSTPVISEYVADPNFNVGLTSTYGTNHSQPSNAVMQAPNLISISATHLPNSSWKAFYSTGGTYSSTAAPTVTTGLNLTSGSGFGNSTSGVYQKISNLVVGITYTLEVTITTGSSGSLHLGNTFEPSNQWTVLGNVYNNLGATSAFLGTTTAGTLSYFVIPQYTEEVLVLDYRDTSAGSITISNVSLKPLNPNDPAIPVVYSNLTDGQVICDLYEDEAIPLSLSIDDFKNVAEKTQSYSKDFHLPNTKRNNKIFSHIFEVTRTTDAVSFNPYAKTRAILKEDSYTLFEGFLRLIDIKDKESEISYNVNLFSEPVTLKEVLDSKTFADIDFTELQHDYTITNIKNSWSDTVGLELDGTIGTTSVAYDSSLTSPTDHTNVLKYPFVNWKGDFYLNPTSTPPNNIGLQNLEQVFRPFIQIRYLIKRIINEAGVEFVSDFFDTAEFKKLFMDFNWGQGLGSSEVMESFYSRNNYYATAEPLIYAGTSFTEMEMGSIVVENPTGIGATYLSGNTITAIHNNTTLAMSYQNWIYNSEPANPYTYEAEWQHYDDSAGTTTSIDNTGTISLPAASSTSPVKDFWGGNFSITMDTGDTLKPVFKADSAAKVFQGNNNQINFGGSVGFASTHDSKFNVALTSIQVAASSLLHAIRGEINQWEFLKGIMTMFNLVVLKEEEILRIEPYKDIFLTNDNSTKRNWTDKVDISEITLKPLELVRKIRFTYEDDEEDYSLNVYKKATSGYLYGTKNLDGSTATASQVSILTGEEEIIATPFAPTLLRPASDLFDATLTIPHIYSGNEDGTEFEDFENLPRILYNLGVKQLSTNTYFVPAQNNVAAINSEDEFLQFGHLTEIPTTTTTPTVDYNFGECQLIQPIGGSPTNNLYQVYYSPYYDELYNPDTRVMTMKVNLTPADIMSFRFYDTVVIKNREYRVNKIEYKPNTLAKVEFILIP